MSTVFRLVLFGLAAMAVLGLLLSFASHIAALLRTPGPLRENAWFLHIGVFFIGLPAVFVTRQRTGGRVGVSWVTVLRGCPRWMKWLGYACCAYAVVNFIVFTLNAPSGSSARGMSPAVVRGFSGHWMAFYAMAMAVFYSAAQMPETTRHCPNGHVVAPGADFCEECGMFGDISPDAHRR